MAKIARTTALMGVRVAVTPASAATEGLVWQSQLEIGDAGTRSPIRVFVHIGAAPAQRLAGNQKEGARKNQPRGRPPRKAQTRVRGSCSDHGTSQLWSLLLVDHNEPRVGCGALSNGGCDIVIPASVEGQITPERARQ